MCVILDYVIHDYTCTILAAIRYYHTWYKNSKWLKNIVCVYSNTWIISAYRCGCDKCIAASKTDSLRYSTCRVNEYRALASPSLMALSSADPILTAFQQSWELRRLARIEKEFTNDYMVNIYASDLGWPGMVTFLKMNFCFSAWRTHILLERL